MKKTHKKILGFAGLGLVAAVTAVAAVMPSSPIASAIGVSDNISVTVTSSSPSLTLIPSEGGTVTIPAYSLKVEYNKLYQMTGTVVYTNTEGSTSAPQTIWNENVGGEAGEKTLNLNFNDLGGYGDFVITIQGLDENGVPVQKTLEVTFEKTDPTPPGPSENPDDEVKPGDDGKAEIPTDLPKDQVTRVSVKVYNTNGEEVDARELDNPDGVESLNFNNLDNGVYTMIVNSYNADGNIVKTETKTLVIKKDGESGGDTISVPIKEEEKTIGQVIITVKDKNGNIVKGPIVLDHPQPGDVADVDISDLPAGEYTTEVDYYDEDGNKIDSTDIPVVKTDGSGNADVEIEKEVDNVTTIEAYVYDKDGNIVRIIRADRETGTVYVYDKDGNLLFTIPNGYNPTTGLTVPMEGLGQGDYTAVITYKDKDGRIIGEAKSVKVEYEDGKAIVVPDTGSFFAGLNLTREDYLITGAVVFTVVGVVAFGVVARKKRAGFRK